MLSGALILAPVLALPAIPAIPAPPRQQDGAEAGSAVPLTMAREDVGGTIDRGIPRCDEAGQLTGLG